MHTVASLYNETRRLIAARHEQPQEGDAMTYRPYCGIAESQQQFILFKARWTAYRYNDLNDALCLAFAMEKTPNRPWQIEGDKPPIAPSFAKNSRRAGNFMRTSTFGRTTTGPCGRAGGN
jgi:hypothetical protein